MKMLNTLMIRALVVIAFVMEQTSSYTRNCVGQFCFTTPGSSELKNFDNAKSWCNEHNSTLAVVNDSDTHMALTEFMQSSNITAMAYINLKLDQLDRTWFLLNGTNYRGWVGNQNIATYNLYCRLIHESDDVTVQASNPSLLNKYICYFEDTMCLPNTTNYFNFNRRCYVKYENKELTWFKARERCIQDGGDLAQFQFESGDPWVVPFNKSYLQPSFNYWVGIRWMDWSWKYPDNDKEIIYSSWGHDRPNNYDYSCVCVDPDVTPAWSWTDCDCTSKRSFVCLEIVPTTTVITTTPTTPTMTSPISTSASVTAKKNINDSINYGEQKQLSKPQIIGLAAGIGGISLILLIVVITVVAVVIMRRKRSNDSSESRPAVEDSGENDDEGQSNQATVSNVKDLYSQVQKPPRIQVNNSHGNDVYAQVKKSEKNQVINDVYAEVVPSAKQQTNKTESPPEILYSAPEFVQDPNSPTANPDYDVACRVQEPDMLSTTRGQIQSMFPIRYSNQYANDEEAD